MTKPVRVPASPRSTAVKRPTKPGRARKRVSDDRPPPEAAVVRDRVAPHESTFVDGPRSSDDVAERMGEDAVSAITSGEDETEAERGDGDGVMVVEKALRDDHLFDDPEEPDAEDIEEEAAER